MEEFLTKIRRQLADVPKGKLLMRRHRGELEVPCFVQECDTNTDGRGLAVNYPLFSGITLTHNYYQASQYGFLHAPMASVMQINHCRYGRIGWKLCNGLSIYLGPGDLSIHTLDTCARSEMNLPLGYYEGIAISVDTDRLAHEQPEILRDAGISGKRLREKFCRDGATAAMPASVQIEHIFSELYQLPDALQMPYYKLKVQELLLFLSMLEPERQRKLDQYLSPQVEIIKAVHKQLTEHPEKRYTIEELAKEHLINTSSLKAVFKSVYGVPVAAYMKAFRMRLAAKKLRETGDSIAEIAAQVGYGNQSKFTAAFKEELHLLPTAYRKQYREQAEKQGKRSKTAKLGVS